MLKLACWLGVMGSSYAVLYHRIFLVKAMIPLTCTSPIGLTFIYGSLQSHVDLLFPQNASTLRVEVLVPSSVCSMHSALIAIPVTARDYNSSWYSISPAHYNYRTI